MESPYNRYVRESQEATMLMYLGRGAGFEWPQQPLAISSVSPKEPPKHPVDLNPINPGAALVITADRN